MLDRSPLLEAFRDVPYIANKHDTSNGFTIQDVEIPTIELASGLIGTTNGSARPSISRITIDKVLARPMYVDQVLPFDIVITAANEYGSFAKMVIHGVEILNSGSGLSIDDISLDEACTFVATRVTPWQNQGFIRAGKGGQVTDISA